MKIFNHSKNACVAAAQSRKPRQPLLTLLEPRRMMSVTSGLDYTSAPDSAPAQFTHTFGFEHTLGAVDSAGPMMPINAGFEQPNVDLSAFDAQFARAIAQGISTNLANSNFGDEVSDHEVHVNTLTSMYSSLNNSTVIAIDNAPTTSTDATLKLVGDTTFHASLADNAAGVTATAITAQVLVNHDLAIASTSAPSNAISAIPRIAPIATTIASAISLPTSALLSASTIETTPPRISMQALEQELLTVSTLASEVISQLGRDIAIELSHFESDMSFDSINEQLSSHLDGWRSAAAVAGAAIATIVYVQSEASQEKTKATTTFSSKLIEAVIS